MASSLHPAIKPGSVAVITGAGHGGIGFALAQTFARSKLRLALIDNDTSALKEAVSALGLDDDDVLAIEADVSKYEEMVEAAQKVQKRFGKVNVLCLNAGVGLSGVTCWNGKMDGWHKVRTVAGGRRVYGGWYRTPML